MGQLFSSDEELSQAKDVIGSLLCNAMLEGGGVPDLAIIHPLLASYGESSDSLPRLQEQLRQLQGDIGNRAPTYLRDLIGKLSAFSDEPRVAGLVGLMVIMVMDMAFTSTKQSSGGKGKSAGSSSSQQRVWELQEVMEEFLKRCRINLNNKSKLIQDSVRLEAQLSLTLTQLKTCLLGGDCDSRSLRHWASAAAFHTQMLVHLAGLEGHAEPLSARAALEQYKEDLTQIIPSYRRFKSNTVCIVKCRGGLLASCEPSSEMPEEGSMTGLTVTDRETGKSVTIPLSAMETEIERRRAPMPDNTSKTVSVSLNLDLITSDQYTQAYLDHLFSDKGPVAELERYFVKAVDNMKTLRTETESQIRSNVRNEIKERHDEPLKDQAEGTSDGKRKDESKDGQGRNRVNRRQEEDWEYVQRGECLRLSIMETQPDESLGHSLHSTTSS